MSGGIVRRRSRDFLENRARPGNRLAVERFERRTTLDERAIWRK
jgi:hypothetical protein